MSSTGNSWQIIFAPQSHLAENITDFLENYFEVLACNFTDDGLEEYVGYASSPIDEAALCLAAKNAGIALPPYRIEFLPATNWLTKNVIKFPPLISDKFYIYGVHEETSPKTDKHSLRIYAATAFGSGQHQTTRSCLKLLEYVQDKGFSAANILDMGCGSGILALAALQLYPEASAIAADIDQEAVIVAMQNAADNGLDNRLHTAAGDGYANPLVNNAAPYDLIFSNILARPLIEMAPQLASHLQPGGFAILSGFTGEQKDWVLEAYRQQGLYEVKTICDENWRAVLVEKSK